ncbi:hypothetical protein DWW90_03030 [Parabacteroides sp. AF17-28]|jgi:hypothetical protein|nr:hypothetical protein DWW90_03030 [Parabacteroides sp. AF17-28]
MEYMKEEEHQEYNRLREPMVEYKAKQPLMPSYVYEDIKVGIEQADQGLLIPFEGVMSRYR